jgi:succinyl-CoA synthetase alpha subunit
MIVRRKDGVIVLGITGKQGTFWTEKMIGYGTNVVAGINPKRAGESHVGVPIFATTSEAVKAVGGDVGVMFIPPPMAKDAAVSAAQAGIKTLVVLTEHIPAQDVMAMHAAAARHGTRIVGPNTAGLVTPGECFVGIMPAFVPSVFKAGRVGVISRSGSLGTLICLNLTRAGIGQSAFIGIGGDPMLGTTTRDALEALDKDAGTDAVVIVGEIGGSMEENAAEYAKKMRKPMVAFIAGAAAPAGKKMGHAGAIVTGNAGSYASKRQALEAGGVVVVDTPSQIGPAIAGLMASPVGAKAAAGQK